LKTLVMAVVGGLVLAGGGTITAMAGSAVTGAPGSSACTDGHYWIGIGSIAGMNVEGRPTGFRAGGKEGLYIWHDCDGWSLRTTDPVIAGSNPVHIYSGVVTTNGKYSTFDAFKLEKEDQLTETSLSSFDYQFKTYTHKDGVNWRTTGTIVTFDVSRSPDKDFIVYVGKEKAVPTSDVFSFELVTVGGQGSGAASSGIAGGALATGLDPRAHHGVIDAGAPRRRGSSLQLRALNRARI
jgi:hypothetical protein